MNYSRQSFLGPDSQRILSETTVAIIGYSGGGSHLGEQLSRIGIGNFIVIDMKKIHDIHLPRLIGSTIEDVSASLDKVEIAERQIKRGNPIATVRKFNSEWQRVSDELLNCDIVFGSVDSYSTRNELEKFCRRNLIPYIDIGMDVHPLGENSRKYLISGQVIQSLPNGYCMWCCGFLDEDKITRESANYREAGEAPQVIWTNGVLASTAVSWGIELLCPWYENNKLFRYLNLDGNSGILTEPPITKELQLLGPCSHHSTKNLGDSKCDIRNLIDTNEKQSKCKWTNIKNRFKNLLIGN